MSKKILIIEDDILLGEIMLRKIKDAGFEAELVVDGGLGLKKIVEFIPDLILLDVMLPTINGYDILEAKKNDKNIANIPVIIISNSGQPVEISRVLALGAKDYLVKAEFDPGEFMVKVKTQLESSENTAGQSHVVFDVDHSENAILPICKKIFWVEDDLFLTDMVTRKFKDEKCELVHFPEGTNVVEKAKTEKPDIIVLDILLSGMSGYDILEALKAEPQTASIPVMMLSNLGQKSDFEKAEKLGADKFLIKATVTLDEIITEINNMIEKKSKK